MLSRWPSSGGRSFSMSWVKVTARPATAELVSATGPPSPMFSPALVQVTPAALSRAPMAGSPAHWWLSPQPPAMVRSWADALACRPDETVRAGSPAAERAWLMRART